MIRICALALNKKQMTVGLICSHLLYIQQLDERARISRYH